MAGLAALVTWAASIEAQRDSAPTSSSLVATVGPQRITRQDLDPRARIVIGEYERRTGGSVSEELSTLLQRHALESLIRVQLIRLESKRLGLRVPDAEVEAEIRKDPYFQENGRFSEAKLKQTRESNPAAFQEIFERVRAELAARRLRDRLETEQAPDEAALRARVSRSLERVRVDVIGLPFADYSGLQLEPRETDVLDYYRAHREDFRAPARAVLSVVRITAPVGVEGRAQERTWRERADSALAAVQGGATLEAIGAVHGGVVRDVVVLPDNFPGFWGGDAATSASVFTRAPGTVLAAPVPGRPGWLIVRVDQSRPAQPAPLREVATQIRATLRDRTRSPHEEREIQALYQEHSAALKGPAFWLRYAVTDTSRLDVGEPSAADLERHYRGHMADYTRYDPATAAIQVQPLAEVTDDVRRSWRRERRANEARAWAERLQKSWSRGKRDRALERAAHLVREVGPLPEGAPVDSGVAGRVLTDTLRSRGFHAGAGVARHPSGWIVYHVHRTVPDYSPTLDQVRPMLATLLYQQREEDIEREARAMFERDPGRFAARRVMYFTRVAFDPPKPMDVPLTRKEVERYHLEHIDEYSAPEQVRARHILISPSSPGSEAEGEARREAEGLLQRIRGGEDFASLARRYTDDPATRESGGDLGTFGRGAMLGAFERAVFALKPGEISEVVHTEVGFHIIQQMEYLPMVAKPLTHIYSNVGMDAALEKGHRVARARADSVYSATRTAAAARAAAKKLGLRLSHHEHPMGSTNYTEEARLSMARLETLKPGEMYPGVVTLKQVGTFIQWVDSIGAGRKPTWQEVAPTAIAEYRREAGRRAITGKQAELDSMLASGWSFDSLADLRGAQVASVTAKDPLPGLGRSRSADSLLFGIDRHPPLAVGSVGGWVELPEGMARMRVLERTPAPPSDLATRLESERRLTLEYNLSEYFERLKQRFPVRIVDPNLRGVALPPPPKPSVL